MTISARLRRLGMSVALAIATTAALIAPAAPASAAPVCTLDIGAPTLNPGTGMVEGPAVVTCEVAVNRIDLQIWLLREDRYVDRQFGHSPPGNRIYNLKTASPCRSGKWRTFASFRVFFPNGYLETKSGYNPIIELPPLQINC